MSQIVDQKMDAALPLGATKRSEQCKGKKKGDSVKARHANFLYTCTQVCAASLQTHCFYSGMNMALVKV